MISDLSKPHPPRLCMPRCRCMPYAASFPIVGSVVTRNRLTAARARIAGQERKKTDKPREGWEDCGTQLQGAALLFSQVSSAASAGDGSAPQCRFARYHTSFGGRQQHSTVAVLAFVVLSHNPLLFLLLLHVSLGDDSIRPAPRHCPRRGQC